MVNRLAQLEQQYGQASSRVAQLERELYEARSLCEAVKSDALLCKSDLNQRNIENQNLLRALEQLESERKDAVKRINDDYTARLEKSQRRLRAEVEEVESMWSEKLRKEAESKQLLQQKCDEESLMRRKLEYDVNSERKKMQKTFETALAQMKNSQQDVVDRTLITNLLVSYFQRKRFVPVQYFFVFLFQCNIIFAFLCHF